MNRRWLTQSALCLLLGAASGVGRTAAAQVSREGQPGTKPDFDEDGQLPKLPRLPSRMTLTMIREGDSIFHGKGGCTTCHGSEAQGMPASGSSLTSGLHFIPTDWHVIDSLITTSIPESVTRTPIAMPPRGAQSNLTPDEVQRVAAYVWAISQVRGEPWPGGHQSHGGGSAPVPTPMPSR